MCVNQKFPPFEFARPERAQYGCFISAVTRMALKRPAGILMAFVCVSHGGSNISLRPEGSTGTLFFMKTTRTGRMLRPLIRLILKNVCDLYFCVQLRSLDLKAGTFTLNPFGTFYTSILERALLIFLENGATAASRLITRFFFFIFFVFVFFVVVVVFFFFVFVSFVFFCGLWKQLFSWLCLVLSRKDAFVMESNQVLKTDWKKCHLVDVGKTDEPHQFETDRCDCCARS